MNLADRPRSPSVFSSCETDAENGIQTCYLSDGNVATEAPSAGPMQELEIPQ